MKYYLATGPVSALSYIFGFLDPISATDSIRFVLYTKCAKLIPNELTLQGLRTDGWDPEPIKRCKVRKILEAHGYTKELPR